ncbi:hypothetical protein TWF694_008974 [Orbilia ellipsospora]|uniref:Uncharacterized protein n=1 Tax=Orbilia ellipsospora TaxID=2528407 RepID=A0AAV9XJZ6_9PEZI
MLLKVICSALLPLTNLSVISAWSFDLIRTGRPRFPRPTSVQTGIKACAPLPATSKSTIRVIGLRIYQPARITEIPTPLVNLEVDFIGFWSNIACDGLPKIIMHFYKDRETAQQFTEEDVRRIMQ